MSKPYVEVKRYMRPENLYIQPSEMTPGWYCVSEYECEENKFPVFAGMANVYDLADFINW